MSAAHRSERVCRAPLRPYRCGAWRIPRGSGGVLSRAPIARKTTPWSGLLQGPWLASWRPRLRAADRLWKARDRRTLWKWCEVELQNARLDLLRRAGAAFRAACESPKSLYCKSLLRNRMATLRNLSGCREAELQFRLRACPSLELFPRAACDSVPARREVRVPRASCCPRRAARDSWRWLHRSTGPGSWTSRLRCPTTDARLRDRGRCR